MNEQIALQKHVLEIRNLHASVDGKEILKGLNLTVRSGEVHALMGPNGSGKSTLAYVLMGHPKYSVSSGEILFDNENILEMSPNERAKRGLFLAFQYPVPVPGVGLFNFLRTAYNAVSKKEMPPMEFKKLLDEKMRLLGLDASFSARHLNDGFSGGEKKRCEILQMALLNPKIAVLDETDSGLDIDALRIVAEGINSMSSRENGVLLITHYNRILKYIKPDHVHIMKNGRIVKSGGQQLSEQLEEKGYDWVNEE